MSKHTVEELLGEIAESRTGMCTCESLDFERHQQGCPFDEFRKMARRALADRARRDHATIWDRWRAGPHAIEGCPCGECGMRRGAWEHHERRNLAVTAVPVAPTSSVECPTCHALVREPCKPSLHPARLNRAIEVGGQQGEAARKRAWEQGDVR